MWTEDDSAEFLANASSLVPDRDRQLEILVDLLPDPTLVVELGCGEGLLSEAILRRFPGSRVVGCDGSETMLAHARFRNPIRFEARRASLPDPFPERPDAVVSSLALHHLDAAQKRDVYAHIFQQLQPGGVLAVADLIEPATPLTLAIAGREWDRACHPGDWNVYRFPDPETDRPSGLFEQLSWLAQIGFTGIDVAYLRAGHAIFTGTRRLN